MESPLKILHIVPSYKPAFIYGGPIVSVSQLCESQAALGHEVVVYTTTANGRRELDVPAGVPQQVDGVAVTYFRRLTGDHTHVSIALWRHLWKTCREYEVIHLHSWWSPLMLMVSWICILKGKRPVLAPRGMLGSYTFTATHSPAKRLIHATVGKRLLHRTVLHATTRMELDECLDVIPDWPHFVLPNIVLLPSENYTPTKNQVFTIGFLSRIDPKKGIELLLEALSEVHFPFKLRIAGEGEETYLQTLNNRIRQLGLVQQVEWCGWMKGNDKYHFLAECDWFALTSYNENFANVVIEALAVGTPVLVSHKVGLFEYVLENRLGLVCGLSVEEIKEQLIDAYEKGNDSVDWKRERLMNVIKQDFSAEKLAEKYLNAYTTTK